MKIKGKRGRQEKIPICTPKSAKIGNAKREDRCKNP